MTKCMNHGKKGALYALRKGLNVVVTKRNCQHKNKVQLKSILLASVCIVLDSNMNARDSKPFIGGKSGVTLFKINQWLLEQNC